MQEPYLFDEKALHDAHWDAQYTPYMFPQGDGTLQIGMGLNELYCLAAYDLAPAYNRLLVLDMQTILRPSLSLLLRAKLPGGLGAGNPCYSLDLTDMGETTQVDWIRYGEGGFEDATPLASATLGDEADPYEYNRYEIGLFNEENGVRLLLRVNGKTLIDTLDEHPLPSHREAGYLFFQSAFTTVLLRGIGSDVASRAERPTKVGEYEGIGLYDVTGLSSVTTRALTIVTVPLVFTASNGMQVPYRLYLPAHYDPNKRYPLHIHLHGGGARGTDNMTQIMHDFNQIYGLIRYQATEEFLFALPECPEDRYWTDAMTYDGEYHMNIDFARESELTVALAELTRTLCGTYAVDAGRVYLSGASMGGMGSYDMLARYPDLYAAAWIGCAANDLRRVAQQAKTPIYLLHGDQDVTIPVHWARETAAAMQEIGAADFVYEEVPGRGHDFSSLENIARAMAWVHSKARR